MEKEKKFIALYGKLNSPEDFLTVIDESHVSVPQIKGMYHGDRSR